MPEERHGQRSKLEIASEPFPDPSPEPPPDYDPTTTEFIMKVQERCNLACTYCYMYELRDQSYLEQPYVMSSEVVQQAARRIGEHADKYELDNVKVIFHGGEPLLNYLLDRQYFTKAAGVLKAAIGAERTDLNMQTNGMFIATHPEVLDVLHEAGIKIGISLDGDQETHDSLRIRRNGQGSFEQVAAGIRTFAEWNRRNGGQATLGLLSVINLSADPHSVYDTLTQEEFGARSFDLLLPLAHHSELPPGYGPGYDNENAPTPYADWLIPLYDRWAQEDVERVSMRLFRSIQRLIFGRPAKAEYIGNSFAANLTIEADGSMVLADSYRVVADGAPMLLDHQGRPFNVWEHSIDQAASHPKAVGYRLGKSALAAECQRCHIVDICGAGLQAHRWRDDASLENGGSFLNRSVYCADLTKLILHIRSRLIQDARAARAKQQTSSPPN